MMLQRIARQLALATAIVVVMFTSAAAASAAPPLGLEEVLDSVAGTHPDLEVAGQDVDKAEGKALAAKGGFDPTLLVRSKWTPVGYYQNGQVDALARQATPAWGIGVYAGYRVGWGSYPVYKGDLQTLSGGEIRAGVDVPVWRNGPIDSRRAKIKQTKILQSGARKARDAAELNVQREAARAYWTWVAAGQSLRVARELLSIAELRDARLNEQASAGAIERIKLVDNRRLVFDRMTKVVAAEQKFQEASLKLSLFLRDGALTPITPGEERVPNVIPGPVGVDAPDLDDIVDEAVRNRPDVAALLAERSAAEVEVRLARNQRAPEVNLQTFVARDFGDGPAQLGPTEWGIGLNVALPLPLRQARGEYRAAKAELGSLDAKARGLRDKIAAEVRAAHVALSAASQTIVLAAEQLRATEQLADAERTRFREGASDLLVVNLRELAVADAANQKIEALAEYHRAHADFLTSSGRPPRPASVESRRLR